jgi:hypothetical protein
LKYREHDLHFFVVVFRWKKQVLHIHMILKKKSARKKRAVVFDLLVCTLFSKTKVKNQKIVSLVYPSWFLIVGNFNQISKHVACFCLPVMCTLFSKNKSKEPKKSVSLVYPSWFLIVGNFNQISKHITCFCLLVMCFMCSNFYVLW